MVYRQNHAASSNCVLRPGAVAFIVGFYRLSHWKMQEMLRFWVAVFASIMWFGAGTAQESTSFSRAMAAVRTQAWSEAFTEMRQTGRIGRDIVEWHRLRAGEGSVGDVLDFLTRNPDWPGLDYLKKQSEPAFADASAARTVAFFSGEPAQTAEGALIRARQLERQNDTGSAQAEIVLAWRTLAVGPTSHGTFIKRHGKLLKPHHAARMDFLLWKGWNDNANRMMPLVSDGWKRLARARLGLRDRVKGVDGLIAAVPQALQDDPGLAFERFQWRARKGRNASAIELLLQRIDAKSLGEAAHWAGWQRSLAREKMRAGEHALAYKIASGHGLVEGSSYSDLEWLSGYLALRFLDKPAVALAHFLRFEQSIETPISLGRAGYWIGRSFEAMGETDAALNAYRGGGRHQTSFYGLLAAEKAGMPADPALKGNEVFDDWHNADFTRSSVHHAALMFLKAGEVSLAERFWLHLAESQDRAALGQMGQMVQDLKAPHIAVMLGKRIVRQGVTLPGPYYPLHPLIRQDLPVPTEMSLAIARRESEFDPVVVSHAGARGLMQLMPGTAKQVAHSIGEKYSRYRLTSDPVYNAVLGSAYLADLADTFDGNVIMMAAGYNAGPSRPNKWMAQRGDPRRGGVDIVDWIEHIPFNETRNYVMRVAESLPVYRARLGKKTLPIPFSQELVGSTVRATR